MNMDILNKISFPINLVSLLTSIKIVSIKNIKLGTKIIGENNKEYLVLYIFNGNYKAVNVDIHINNNLFKRNLLLEPNNSKDLKICRVTRPYHLRYPAVIDINTPKLDIDINNSLKKFMNITIVLGKRKQKRIIDLTESTINLDRK